MPKSMPLIRCRGSRNSPTRSHCTVDHGRPERVPGRVRKGFNKDLRPWGASGQQWQVEKGLRERKESEKGEVWGKEVHGPN